MQQYQPGQDVWVRVTLDSVQCDTAILKLGTSYTIYPLSAIRPAEPIQQGWRPIETAPKDGSLILGWDNKIMRGKGAACVMLWARNESTGKHEWMNFWNAYRVDCPTMWQPLPQPPSQQQEVSK